MEKVSYHYVIRLSISKIIYLRFKHVKNLKNILLRSENVNNKIQKLSHTIQTHHPRGELITIAMTFSHTLHCSVPNEDG